jgi:nitrogen-specific signal transduction histidine kinase
MAAKSVISAKITDDRVEVDRENTDPGVPLSIRDRLFESFATTGKDGGCGLGLAKASESPNTTGAGRGYPRPSDDPRQLP